MPKIVKWYSYSREAGGWVFHIVYVDGWEAFGGPFPSARQAAEECAKALEQSERSEK